ncbi:MAG: hypothetical protein Kow00108_18250 [Calditrichia bacterium]
MSKSLGIIIDNDFNYDKELVKKLEEYSFHVVVMNEINQINSIKSHIHRIPAFFLINLKSGDLEGLGIYKLLNRFYPNENIRYYFLINNQSYVNLMNELKIKVRYFLKGQQKIDFICMEIYKDHILRTIQKENIYKPVLKSNLKELPLEIVLKYCEDFYFTGNLILKRLDDIAIVQFQKGLIEKIKYNQYDLESALDKILEWTSGTFILEARTHTVEEISEMYSYIFNLIPAKTISIEEVLDIFYNWIAEYTAQYSLIKYMKHSYLALTDNFEYLKKNKDKIFEYLDKKENTGLYLDESVVMCIAAWLKLTTARLSKLNDSISFESFMQEIQEKSPELNSQYQFNHYYDSFDTKTESFIFKLTRQSNLK